MLKKLLPTVIFSLFCAVAFCGTPLKSGTVVQVVIVDALNSKTSLSAQGRVANDVVQNGKVLIRKGTVVALDVKAEKATALGCPGTLDVKAVSTNAVDGQTVMLTSNVLYKEGVDRKALTLGIGIGLGWAILPLACLAIKGGEAEIPVNATLNAAVFDNYVIGDDL